MSMSGRPTYDELAKRITEHLVSAPDSAELVAACWEGYLAALIEWGLITPDDHARLGRLLPTLSPNPVMQIFLGA
jgi:hypothetical protein